MAVKQKDKGLFGGKSRYGAEDEPAKPSADAIISMEIDQLEKDLNELRSQYELYFMGVEKLEPTQQRGHLKSTLRRWQEMRPKNTALKFRIQQLKARMVSLENYWSRITRQREAGTYHRDKARVSRREQDRMAREHAMKRALEAERGSGAMTADHRRPPGSEGQAITGQALRDGKSGASTAGHGRTPAAASPSMSRPRASSAEDLTEPKLRKLYQTYVGARKRCGEKVDLRFEDMAAALRKQVPKLMKDTGAKSVEFKVVIRGGRAVLKALPK
ncbi:MAG: MXAN_5187 C-terminal domain-containing protein [Deltaproteobacteria bacterium]